MIILTKENGKWTPYSRDGAVNEDCTLADARTALSLHGSQNVIVCERVTVAAGQQVQLFVGGRYRIATNDEMSLKTLRDLKE